MVVVHFDRGSPARLKSQVNVEHSQKAPQKQSSADQQHAGQCDLRDHQHRAQALVLSPRTHSGTGVLERLLRVAA